MNIMSNSAPAHLLELRPSLLEERKTRDYENEQTREEEELSGLRESPREAASTFAPQVRVHS